MAASGEQTGDELGRLPAGEVHAWYPGQNETQCGLSLFRSQLRTFGAVLWPDVQPESGGSADFVQDVCPRCLAATGRRPQRRWTREHPRP